MAWQAKLTQHTTSGNRIYRTRNSWFRGRRVIGKAEYLPNKANPRFVDLWSPACPNTGQVPSASMKNSTVFAGRWKTASSITVRKVWLPFSGAYPYASDFAQVLVNVRRYPAWAPPG